MRSFLIVSLLLFLWSRSLVLLAAAPTEPPLPPVQTVIDRVAQQARKEAANDREFDLHYSYTRSKVTKYHDDEGKLLRRECKTNHHDPQAVLAKRQTALSASPPAHPEAKRDNKLASTGRGKAIERKDIELDRELLSRFRFKFVGRELVDGHHTLVVDFQPASSRLPERNFKDRFINRAAGCAWVDESSYVVVKVALHLTEPVRIWGGLVGVVWAFDYAFDRDQTPDGLWYTRHVKWHLDAREVFAHRIMDYQENTSHLRKAR